MRRGPIQDPRPQSLEKRGAPNALEMPEKQGVGDVSRPACCARAKLRRAPGVDEVPRLLPRGERVPPDLRQCVCAVARRKVFAHRLSEVRRAKCVTRSGGGDRSTARAEHWVPRESAQTGEERTSFRVDGPQVAKRS